MQTIRTDDLKNIVGAKNVNDFFQEVIKPTVIGGGAAIGGLGGAAAATVAIYGIEGFIQAAPAAIDALDRMNKLSDAQLLAMMNDPYRYP